VTARLAGRLRRLRRRNGSRCRLRARRSWTGVAARAVGGVKAERIRHRSSSAYRTATAPTAARRGAPQPAARRAWRASTWHCPVEIVSRAARRDRVAEATLATTARARRERCLVGNAPLGCLFQVPAQEAVTFSPSAVETGGWREDPQGGSDRSTCDDVGRVAHNRDGAVEVAFSPTALRPQNRDLNRPRDHDIPGLMSRCTTRVRGCPKASATAQLFRAPPAPTGTHPQEPSPRDSPSQAPSRGRASFRPAGVVCVTTRDADARRHPYLPKEARLQLGI